MTIRFVSERERERERRENNVVGPRYAQQCTTEVLLDRARANKTPKANVFSEFAQSKFAAHKTK